MDQGEKINEAQEILDWAIMHLNVSIKCKVVDYKHENFRVHVFKENKLMMPVQILEEWIRSTNPRENFIHEKIEILFKNLENY